MLAVRIVSHEGAGRLEVCEVERPTARADRVRVRVRAAGLNRADLLQKRGRYPAPPGAPADIPGLEFAGEVEQVGDDGSMWRVGAHVFGITAGGAQAEYVVVPESHLAAIPQGLSFEEAAAVPEVFITAHDALFTQGLLRTGERVLIHAVGSGVGTAAAQLARAAGAGAVYGTARTAEKIERAREFGMDNGVVVSDDPRAFTNAVWSWTGGEGVHVVLDLVGSSYLDANLEALALRGRLLLVGTLGGRRRRSTSGTCWGSACASSAPSCAHAPWRRRPPPSAASPPRSSRSSRAAACAPSSTAPLTSQTWTPPTTASNRTRRSARSF